jgi:hypothetical protein
LIAPNRQVSQFLVWPAEVFDVDEVGAAAAAQVDVLDADAAKLFEGLTSHAEADFLDDDRHVQQGHGLTDTVEPAGKVPVTLGHYEFLRGVHVELQGIGGQHVHGCLGLMGGVPGADVGEHDAVRVVFP